MKIGVLISGGGRTLLNLDQKIKKKSLNANISVVISSSRKCLGVERAKKLGFPVFVLPRKKRYTDEQYSMELRRVLAEYEVELVVMAGFLKKFLPGDDFPKGCINIHPSLIPSFCGPGFFGSKVHQAVWERGCRVSGCTVHFVNHEYDAGPIILQSAVEIEDTDDPNTIAKKVFDAECEALPKAIQKISENQIFLKNGRVITR